MTSLISPYGHASFFYFLILILFKKEFLSIEWGAIDLLYKKKYIEKKFIKYIFKYSKCIWYKEQYMQEKLKKYNEQIFFLPNSTNFTKKNIEYYERNIDLLWFNNFENRYPELLIESLKLAKFDRFINCVMVGDSKNKFNKNNIISKNYNLKILNFSDNKDYIYKSKFFILFAPRIFGNNSLLETMSVGTIPIVSKVDYSNEIVIDNVNGYIIENNIMSITKLLEKISTIKLKKWNYLS